MPEPKANREDYLSKHKPLAAKESSTALSTSHTQDMVDHLSELRNRILISIGSIIAATLIAFYFSGPIIKFLEAAAPAGSTFFQLKPGELFFNSFKVSVFIGLVVSLPIIINQVAIFINPGLKDNERRIIGPILWLAPILFFVGIIFAYYLVLPPLLEFLLGFRTGVVETRYGLEHFINLEISILGLCGICFQLPIILITLVFFKILSTTQLLAMWRYVVLGAFIIAAVLTPTPDPLTMSILAVALLGLYFGTIAFLSLFKSKN